MQRGFYGDNIFFPLLRLRKILLAGELRQSRNLPPLPVIDGVQAVGGRD